MRRIVFIAPGGLPVNLRVQKLAQAAAEQGWEVVVVGRTGALEPVEWMKGDVAVRLVPTPRPLATSIHMLRAAQLRAPLAYRPSWKPGYQTQSVRARQDDLAFRRSQLKTSGRPRDLLHRLQSKRLAVETLATRGLSRWVGLRTHQIRRLQAARRYADKPVDKLVTAGWQRWLGVRAWGKLDPSLWDYEISYGPAIDALDPDVVFVGGSRLLHVGARAVLRARGRGLNTKLVWDVQEFAPFAPPGRTNLRRHRAQCLQEREYAPSVDVVTTVSEGLADLIRCEYDLPSRPTVIADVPVVDDDRDTTATPDVRARCGLDASTPLLVYSGLPAEHRGLRTVVDALPELEDVHVALVVPDTEASYPRRLRNRARKLGVDSRVHLLPYVEHGEVVHHLATADVGIDTNHHRPGDEVVLPPRYYDYSRAKLPMVVSDLDTIGGAVAATGIGEIFRAEDTGDFVRAVRTVLADPERYRAAYEKPGTLDSWTWESQAVVLGDVLAQLAPSPDGRR